MATQITTLKPEEMASLVNAKRMNPLDSIDEILQNLKNDPNHYNHGSVSYAIYMNDRR